MVPHLARVVLAALLVPLAGCFFAISTSPTGFGQGNIFVIVRTEGSGDPVRGTAWVDHEWSSQYLAPEASGWDWCGLNLDDGGALMAFRIRDKAGGTFYAPPGVAFTPLRTWRSPRTGVHYPVAMRVTAGGRDYELEPLMDDQELDARASTGNLYWEGAVRARRASRQVGRGYLELTGYGAPLRL